MAARESLTDSLLKIPSDISPLFLPRGKCLSDRVLQKALNFFTQGYIHQIRVRENDSEAIQIDARCWRSMRKSEDPHRLHLELKENAISDSFCSCKVGVDGHCSHIVGLLKCLQGFKLHNFVSIPDEQSCTSVPQQWHVPRGAKISPVPMNEIVVAKPKEERKRKPLILPEVSPEDKLKLAALKGTPLQHLMLNTAPMVTTSTYGQLALGSILSYQTKNLKKPQIQITSNGCGDISVRRSAPVKLPPEFREYNQNITPEEIDDIEQKTRQQSNSDLWKKVRQNRLTASNFGKVMKRKSPPSQSFLDTVFNRQSVNAAPLDYGRRNESNGKRKYLKQYPSSHLHECGFVINAEFSFLGASPDGKLCCDGESGIVEIKCPYSARNMKLLDACEQVKEFCLQRHGGKMSLKRDHEYYAQIQGQLMITGCDFCEFIVYTHCDLFVERILPNTHFMSIMLNKLAAFYRDHSPK